MPKLASIALAAILGAALLPAAAQAGSTSAKHYGTGASVATDISSNSYRHHRRHVARRVSKTPGHSFNEGNAVTNPGQSRAETQRKTQRNRGGD